jgi:hypothetical protein
MLSEEGLEIYVELNDELRQTYKRMTKEEVLADLDLGQMGRLAQVASPIRGSSGSRMKYSSLSPTNLRDQDQVPPDSCA